MRLFKWTGVLLLLPGLIVVTTASAGKGKDKAGAAAEGAAASAPVSVAPPPANPDKAERKAERAEKRQAVAEAKAAEAAKEAGGDATELTTLTTVLNLSDAQQKQVDKEFEKYRARLAEINALPDSSANAKAYKGPQRRELRADLDKWIKGNISPAQAEKYDAYAKKREADLTAERLNSRMAKLDGALKLNDAQKAKLRALYGEQLGPIQNAADAVYVASKKSQPTADLEKQLEAKRDALRSAVEAVLIPEQIIQFKKMED